MTTIWGDTHPQSLTWDDAMAWAETMGNAWQLPTITELRQAFLVTRTVQASNTWTPYTYWSRTADVADQRCAWFVCLRHGCVDMSFKDVSYRARVSREEDDQ
jgi:hypothetical protein